MRSVIIIAIALCPLWGMGQSHEAQQLLLNIEKLRQFRAMLADMKKGYEILDGGYNRVKNLSQDNFKLHKTYLDGLLTVSPSVRNYRKVAAIVQAQAALVRDYRNALNRFGGDRNLRPGELDYIRRVYSRLLKESARSMEELYAVITSGKLRMSDGERIEQIDRIYEEVTDQLMFLRNFNNKTSVLSRQRERERRDAESVGKMYGINQ